MKNIKMRGFEKRAVSGLRAFAGRVLSLVLILTLLFNSIAVDGEAMPRLRLVRAEGALEASVEEMEVALGGDEDDASQEHVYSYAFSGAETRLSDVLLTLALPIDPHALTLDAISLGGVGEGAADDAPLAIPDDPIAVRPTDDGDFIIIPLRPFEETRITIDTPEADCVIRLTTLPDTVWSIPMDDPADEVEYQLAHEIEEPPTEDALDSETIEPFMEEVTDPEPDPEPDPDPDPDPEPDPEADPDPEQPTDPEQAVALTITAGSRSRTYNGEPLTENGYAAEGLLEGHRVEALTITGTQTDVGTAENVASGARIVDADGEDVTERYDIAYVNGALTVERVPVTVTPDAKEKVYGAADPTLTANTTGLLDENDTITYTLTREDGEGVGPYAIAATGDPEQGYYRVTFASSTLTISPAPVTVTAQDASKVYGAADPELTAAVAGLLDGDEIIYTVTREAGEDVGFYAITPTGETTQGNYSVTFVPGVFTIAPAVVTVTANDASKVYGAADPELTAAVTGLQNGDTISYTINRAAGENVGEYAITPTGETTQGNYSVTFMPGTLTISKRPISVSVTGQQSTLIYDGQSHRATGYALAITDASEAPLMDATYAYREAYIDFDADNARTDLLTNVGKRYMGLDANQFANKNANYDVSFAVTDGFVEILPANIAISVTGSRASFDYDGEAHTVAGYAATSESPLFNPGRVVFSGTATASRTDAGATSMGLSEDDFSYDDTNIIATFHVTDGRVTIDPIPAVVTITGNRTTAAYDAEAHTATGYTAAVDTPLYDVTEDFTFTGAATATRTDAGTTAMGLSAAQFRNTNPNFKNVVFAIEDGYVTVNPIPASVTITGHTRKVTYDGRAHSVDGYDVAINEPLYTAADFAFSGAATAMRTEVGKTFMGLSAEQFVNTNPNFANVTFGVTDGHLIVAQALTITAGSNSKTYDGKPLTEDGCTPDGLLTGHSVASLTITGEQTDAGTSENVPSEARIVNAAGEDVTELYDISYENGALTVERAPVTVSPDDAEKIYGDADPALTATVNGMVNGESPELIRYALTRIPGEIVGEYDIYVTGEAIQGNYTVTYDEEPAKFIIDPAVVTVTAVDAGKVYGQRDPEPLTATVDGLKFEDDPSVIHYDVERDEGEDVGPYAIIPSGYENQGNYDVLYVEGTFTISPAPVTVTAANAGKVYGEDDPEYEAAVTGLVGDDDESLIDYGFTRAPGEDVGGYALTPIGEAIQGNYAVTYVGATLTITRAAAVVRPEALDKVYGDADPALTFEVDGLQNDDEADVLTCTVTRAEGEDVGTYVVTVTGAAEQGNYNVTYEPGTFTITPAPVTVMADDLEKAYGSADPTLTASVEGLLNEGDTVSYTLTREEGEGVGNYAVTVTGAAEQGNYQVSFEPGVFTIAPRQITVSVNGNDAISVYDGQPHRTTGYELEITDDSETPLMDEAYIYKKEYVAFEGTAITDPLTDVGEEYMGLNEDQFTNKNSNYAVIFAVSDGCQYVVPRTVRVTITGNHAEFDFDDREHAAQGYVATIADEIDDALYNKANIINYGEAVAVRRDSGRTDMALSAGQFHNVDPNFDVTFAVVDGYVRINPISITVNITGNKGSYEYDGNVHTVTGYRASSESVALFDPTHVVFTGVAEASLVDAGEASMGLHEADFSYNDRNVNATFRITDGSVTVTPITATVTIDGNHDTLFYDGEPHTVVGFTATADTQLYDVDSDIALIDGEASATGTAVGTTYMGLRAEQFGNKNPNFSNVTFKIGDDGYMTIAPISATVTITGNRVTKDYNGEAQSVTGFTATADTPLYDVTKDFTFTGAASATRTDAGTTAMSLSVSQFENKNLNFSEVTFEIDDGFVEITPIPATVTITGHSGSFVYDGAPHTVQGYDVAYSTPLYNANCFRLNGQGSVTRTEAGISEMGLSTDAFENISTNFVDVDFIVTDGAITIDPAIVVSKYLNNELAEGPETFTFHVTLEDDQGEILPDYPLADGITTDAEGRATFTLTAPRKGRASRTLGIPLGGSLSVAEDKTDDPNNYITTVLVNGVEVEASSYDLDYVLDSRITLEFVNAKGNVCRIDDEEFQTISSAIQWAVDNGETEFAIQMLVDYTMPPSDVVTILSGMTVTLTTAPEYEGTGAATISRPHVEDGYAAAMFTNHGTLNIANAAPGSQITLDGHNVDANAAMIVSDGTVNVYGGGTLQNAVNTGDGGAVSGGSVSVFGGELKNNRAQNGGAIYTETGTVSVSGGSMSGNQATADGGAVYTTGGSVSVSGGSVSGNSAVNGGGIYNGTGTVNVSGGSMSGNSASGVGGAVCTASGGVTVSGGTLGGTEANTAVNGSAIFVGTGNGSFSGGEVTGNVATEGGAVGFSSENARLSFSGTARVTGNTMGEAPSNVYLDVDTDWVINAVGLQTGAEIGVYVPGTGELYENRGVSGKRFGGYTSADNLQAFKSDRTPGMTVSEDNFKMMWGRSIAVEIWQVNSISATSQPPVVSGNPRKTGVFFPPVSQNYISDVAAAVMTDPALGGVSSGYTFACAFGKGATRYDECLSMLNWNDQTGDWGFVNADGDFVSYENDPPTLMIFYSTPAYITLANNTEYPLDITSLTVNGIDAASNAYGFVVARKGATVEHFVPLAASDLDLEVGESIKLMFPGARNQNYALTGVFNDKTDADPIPYINYHSGGNVEDSISAEAAVGGFTLGGKLYNNNNTAEVSFGTATMICKIVELNADGTVKEEHRYPTLQSAVSDGNTHYDAYKVHVTDPFDRTVSYDTVKIEMIQDYLIPATDQPDVPAGRNFTFTTATRENGSLGNWLYTGTGNRATISQDQGNTNSFIKVSAGGADTAITVENLNFEGKQLDATKTNGGVISTMNCSLTVRNVRFTNFSAGNGGAVYAQFGGVVKKIGGQDIPACSSQYNENNNMVRVSNAEFDTCASKANVDRMGGGAIWTNAKALSLSNCAFTNCTATQQGGAVYHRIDDDYVFASGSSTAINACHFLHCWANAAGGLEINAYQITIDRCEFDDCQAKTRNGGGFNAYLRAPGTTGTQMNISNTTFNNCFAQQDGGVFRTQMNTTVTNCTFTNNTANGNGGGIAQNNGNLLILDHCTVTGNKSGNMGGGIYTNGAVTLMNDCVITGNSLTTNNVANGAGLYLANNKTLTLGAEGRTTPDTCTISNNLAADGSASNLRLPESGGANTNSVIVRCNFTTGADGDKLIHVLNANKVATQFGTSNVSLPKGFAELEHIFVADNNELYGVYDRTNGTGIVWRGELVCKLTDGSGRLLFFDAEHTDPAVFDSLDNSSDSANKITAFGVLKYGRDDITLYYDDGSPYNAANRTYCVKMLVDYTTEKYLSTKPANLSWQTVILTTAGNDALYPYRGAEGTVATITRGTGVGNNNNLLRVFVNMTLRDITLDGNASKITPNTNTRLITTDPGVATTVVVTLGSGATLQNAHNTGNGAGVMLNWGGSLVIDGGKIVNCVANGNGGAVYKDGGNGEFTFIDGEISGCSASIGGALYIVKHNDGKQSEMRGGVITGCSATTGGAVFVANSHKFYMSGGSITGNRAGTGGGIAVGGTNARLYFSGDAVVYGNILTNETACNVELNYDSDAIINTMGSGLGEDALIGVYATNAARNESGNLFGTRPNTSAHNNDTLSLFINDRNGLRGKPDTNVEKIRWEKYLSLQVSKTVKSPLSADRVRPFTFKVTLTNGDGTVNTTHDGTYGLGRNKLTFAQGVAYFTLKHGELINVVDMPEGVNYIVEEIAAEGVTTLSDEFEVNYEIGTVSASASGDANFVHTVDVTNTRKTGDLTISKWVTDEDDADRSQIFNFRLELQTGSSFQLNGQYGDVEIKNNSVNFTLTHDHSVTASGLPTGIKYTVTEEHPAYRQSVAVNGKPVQAARNIDMTAGENAVVFTNTRKVGGVMVSMEVKSDAAADKNIDFPIAVTLSDRTINGTFGEMTFVNGVASFTLKHGQSITATKLRQGMTYTVSQTVPGFDPKYIYTDAMGRTDNTCVIGTDTSNCAITNTRSKGKLQIKKQLVTDRTRDNATFTFTVWLGNTVNDEFVVDTGITNKYGTVNFINGVSEPIAIIGAASKTISGLPQGIEYQVIEAASDHFELTNSQNANGTIGASTSVATFTNTRKTGSLTIQKTVVSDAAQDREKDFHFTIRLGDAISKTYGDVNFSGGTANITLKHGQSKTISGLPTDVGYTVAETSVSGFTVQSTGASGTIGLTESVAHFTNTREVGNLTVKKQVHSDLAGDADEAFSFTVQLGSIAQGRFVVDESINGAYGGMTFVKGVANFTLSASDAPKKAERLPAELRYMVTEASDGDFNTTSSGASGAISVTRPATATFTNTRRTGTLKLTKNVASDVSADKSHSYIFTVKLGHNGPDGFVTETGLSKKYGSVTFANGEATVTIKPTSGTATVTMSGIPQGLDYSITEAPVDLMDTTATGATGTISAARESNAVFINTRQTGDLTVSKALRGNLTADRNIDFAFTVRLGSVSQTYAAEYADGRTRNVTFSGGEAIFTLKGGEALTIHGLPAGVGYTVLEAADSDFDTAKDGDKGSIIHDAAVEAAFTNTRKTGDLRLTKRVVSDLAGDNDKEFAFTVTVTGADINGDYGDLTFEDGVATVTLSKDESVTATGLPTKLGYAVTEAAVPGFTTTATNAAGSIATGRTDAAFTNTRDTGDLTVSKVLESDLAVDANLNFNYRVTMSDTSIGAVTPETSNGKSFGDMVFKNGVSEFNLRGGHSVTAQGLPAGIGYTVEELNASDDFTCAIKLNGADADTGAGTIDKDVPANVTFTNARKTGDLQISKAVVSNRSKDLEASFKFTVTLTGLSNAARSKTFGDVTLKNGTATISLKNGESLTLTGLPTGASYKVSEKLTTAQMADFATDPESFEHEGTIVESPVSVAAFTNTRKTGDLTIHKVVHSDLVSDMTFGFPFTVTLNDTTLNNTYVMDVTDGAGNTTTGSVTFSGGKSPTLHVRNGEALTIRDLPTDLKATVREELSSAQKKQYTTLPASYTSSATITLYGVEMTFDNTRKVGDLKVGKTMVSDVASDRTAEFDFVVTQVDNPISKTFDLIDQDGTAIEGGVTFEGGVASLRMKHGESRTIIGLPRDLRYTVTEQNPGALYIEPASVTGTISDTTVATATIKNTRKTGTLVVSKQVSNALSKDADRPFSFNVKVGAVVNGNFVPETGVSGTYGDVTIRNGDVSFILMKGEKKTIERLPVGLVYKVTETPTPAAEFEPVSGPMTGTLVEGTSTAAFTNTRKTGKLTVSKALVSERAADADRVFRFTVTADDTIINGRYGGMSFTDGVATFTMKGGESVTAEGLPVTLGYTVTEEPDAGFTTESAGSTGTIGATPSEAVFTNTRRVGDLKVTKTVVSDLAADAERPFDFTVTLDDATISKTYGDMTFENGVATFQLRHGESATATGLPTDVAYTVSEAPASGFIAVSAQQGIIIEGTSTASFTNTREVGDLTVSKAVVSDLAADASQPFDFTVTLGDATISKTYGGMTFTNGVATFSLRGGERLTATGLPTTLTYTVTEAANQSFLTSSTGATGAIERDTPQTAAFTNARKPGALAVTKALVSDLAADKDVAFAFTLTLTGLTDAAKNKTYSGIPFTGGVGTFLLKGGETKELTDLPTGVGYSVAETTPTGFTTERTGAAGTISATKSEATFTNTREKGHLTVGKTLVSDLAADAEQAFDFTVTLGDATISKTYGGMTFTNGVATFSLRGGESLTATGLPTTLTYTVIEAANDKFLTSSTGASGTIHRNATQRATFTNTRKISITLKAEDVELTYNGKTQTGSATASIVEGALSAGHKLTYQYTPASGKDVGGYDGTFGEGSIAVRDASGGDVTERYIVALIPGHLTILPKPLTITAKSAEKTYDGMPLTLNGEKDYEVEGLLSGHYIPALSISGSQTDVGTAENVPSNARIEYAGYDVTKQYAVEYVNGALTVTPKPLTIATGSDEKVYDGTPLTKNEAAITGLVEGETAVATATGSVIDVGAETNAYAIDWLTAKESNYAITEQLGTLTVTPREITLIAPSDSKPYDGIPLTCDGTGEKKVTASNLPDGFTVEATAKGSQTDAGNSENVVNDGYVIRNAAGEVVKLTNFVVTEQDGTLTVDPLKVTVTIIGHNDNTPVYDGNEYSVSGYDVEIREPLYAETYFTFSGTASAARTNAGTTYMGLLPEQFTNTNANFSVTFDVTDGYQTVKPAGVTLTANSGTEIYDDGKEKSVTGFTPSVDGLAFDGVSASGSGINVGTYDVTFDGVTLNETKDTTGNYVVTGTTDGSLTIYPQITVTKALLDPLPPEEGLTFSLTPEYDGAKGDSFNIAAGEVMDISVQQSCRTVTVTEAVSEIYELTGVKVTADNADTAVNLNGNTVSFDVPSGANSISVVLTNERRKVPLDVIVAWRFFEDIGDGIQFSATLTYFNGNSWVPAENVELMKGIAPTNPDGKIYFTGIVNYQTMTLWVPIGTKVEVKELTDKYRTTITEKVGDASTIYEPEGNKERTYIYKYLPESSDAASANARSTNRYWAMNNLFSALSNTALAEEATGDVRSVTFMNYNDAYLKLENYSSKDYVFRIAVNAKGEDALIDLIAVKCADDPTIYRRKSGELYIDIELLKSAAIDVCLPYVGGLDCEVTLLKQKEGSKEWVPIDSMDAEKIMLNSTESGTPLELKKIEEKERLAGKLERGLFFPDKGPMPAESAYNTVSIMDVLSFRKIDGFGNPLPEAEFTLYLGDKPVGDVQTSDRAKDGIVTFAEGLSVGKTYQLKEITTPDGYEANTTPYQVSYTAGAGFVIDGLPVVDGVYTFLNISEAKRKVILRKVLKTGEAFTSLPDRYFTLCYVDGQTVVTIGTEKLENLRSRANGLIWIGMLPLGKYYLYEYKEMSEDWNYWFEVNVERDKVTVGERQPRPES